MWVGRHVGVWECECGYKYMVFFFYLPDLLPTYLPDLLTYPTDTRRTMPCRSHKRQRTLPTGTHPSDILSASDMGQLSNRALLDAIVSQARRDLDNMMDNEPEYIEEELGGKSEKELLEFVLLSMKQSQKKYAGVNSAAVCNRGYCYELSAPGCGQCLKCSE